MRTLLVGLVLMLGVQAFADVEAVKKAAQARDAAYGRGDGEAWGKFVADRCVFTNILTGETNQPKKQMMEAATNRENPTPPKITDQKFHTMEGADAVVRETGHREGPNSSFRYVRVWSKQDDGGWQTISVYTAPDGQ